jgi:DNA (cytosine-5)-methyltransferase 1
MSAYYNEIDPFAAAWLRELIKAKLIADGEVDTRSIELVSPDDVRGFSQCHFFAGIGGWSYALRLAGWPDDRRCWTGSCPCQPWSSAGKGAGADDSRDLWPAWFKLVEQCRPTAIFGEQVAGVDGRAWLDRVYVDLEATDYAIGAANLCAAGATAPHCRQRLFFVADRARARDGQLPARPANQETDADPDGRSEGPQRRAASGRDGMADSIGAERRPLAEGRSNVADWQDAGRPQADGGHSVRGQDDSRVANPDGGHGFWWSGPLQVGWNTIEAEIERGGRKHRAQWRVEPGVPLLAHGIPQRVAQISGFGNAIVPQVAAIFIEAYVESVAA